VIPLAIKLKDRHVLVIGCGVIGKRKAQQLIDDGALVTMVTTEQLTPAPEGLYELLERPVVFSDFDNKLLIISATGDATINDDLIGEARRRGILINCVDDPERCDFYFCATTTRGEVTVAVSSNGSSPALAQAIRDRMEAALPANTAEAATALRALRDAVHASGESTEDIDWRQVVADLLED
jgi:precorrin-2 dehydrogenase / sirohydrochlorin ferrochelatase